MEIPRALNNLFKYFPSVKQVNNHTVTVEDVIIPKIIKGTQSKLSYQRAQVEQNQLQIVKGQHIVIPTGLPTQTSHQMLSPPKIFKCSHQTALLQAACRIKKDRNSILPRRGLNNFYFDQQNNQFVKNYMNNTKNNIYIKAQYPELFNLQVNPMLSPTQYNKQEEYMNTNSLSFYDIAYVKSLLMSNIDKAYVQHLYSKFCYLQKTKAQKISPVVHNQSNLLLNTQSVNFLNKQYGQPQKIHQQPKKQQFKIPYFTAFSCLLKASHILLSLTFKHKYEGQLILKPNFELIHTKQTSLTTKEIKKTRTGRGIGLILELLQIAFGMYIQFYNQQTYEDGYQRTAVLLSQMNRLSGVYRFKYALSRKIAIYSIMNELTSYCPSVRYYLQVDPLIYIGVLYRLTQATHQQLSFWLQNYISKIVGIKIQSQQNIGNDYGQNLNLIQSIYNGKKSINYQNKDYLKQIVQKLLEQGLVFSREQLNALKLHVREAKGTWARGDGPYNQTIISDSQEINSQILQTLNSVFELEVNKTKENTLQQRKTIYFQIQRLKKHEISQSFHKMQRLLILQLFKLDQDITSKNSNYLKYWSGLIPIAKNALPIYTYNLKLKLQNDQQYRLNVNQYIGKQFKTKISQLETIGTQHDVISYQQLFLKFQENTQTFYDNIFVTNHIGQIYKQANLPYQIKMFDCFQSISMHLIQEPIDFLIEQIVVFYISDLIYLNFINLYNAPILQTDFLEMMCMQTFLKEQIYTNQTDKSITFVLYQSLDQKLQYSKHVFNFPIMLLEQLCIGLFDKQIIDYIIRRLSAKIVFKDLQFYPTNTVLTVNPFANIIFSYISALQDIQLVGNIQNYRNQANNYWMEYVDNQMNTVYVKRCGYTVYRLQKCCFNLSNNANQVIERSFSSMNQDSMSFFDSQEQSTQQQKGNEPLNQQLLIHNYNQMISELLDNVSILDLSDDYLSKYIHQFYRTAHANKGNIKYLAQILNLYQIDINNGNKSIINILSSELDSNIFNFNGFNVTIPKLQSGIYQLVQGVSISDEAVVQLFQKLTRLLVHSPQQFHVFIIRYNSIVLQFIRYFRETVANFKNFKNITNYVRANINTNNLYDHIQIYQQKCIKLIQNLINSKDKSRYCQQMFYLPNELGGLGLYNVNPQNKINIQSAIVAYENILTDKKEENCILSFEQYKQQLVKIFHNIHTYEEHNIYNCNMKQRFIPMYKNNSMFYPTKAHNDVLDMNVLNKLQFNQDNTGNFALNLYIYENIQNYYIQMQQKYHHNLKYTLYYAVSGFLYQYNTNNDDIQQKMIKQDNNQDFLEQNMLQSQTLNIFQSQIHQIYGSKLSKAQIRGINETTNKRFISFWSPLINRTHVHMGKEITIRQTDIKMNGKLKTLGKFYNQIFNQNLWLKLHKGIVNDVAYFLKEISKKNNVNSKNNDVQPVNIVRITTTETHSKKAFNNYEYVAINKVICDIEVELEQQHTNKQADNSNLQHQNQNILLVPMYNSKLSNKADKIYIDIKILYLNYDYYHQQQFKQYLEMDFLKSYQNSQVYVIRLYFDIVYFRVAILYNVNYVIPQQYYESQQQFNIPHYKYQFQHLINALKLKFNSIINNNKQVQLLKSRMCYFLSVQPMILKENILINTYSDILRVLRSKMVFICTYWKKTENSIQNTYVLVYNVQHHVIHQHYIGININESQKRQKLKDFIDQVMTQTISDLILVKKQQQQQNTKLQNKSILFISLNNTLENIISQVIKLSPEFNDYHIESVVSELDMGLTEMIEILNHQQILNMSEQIVQYLLFADKQLPFSQIDGFFLFVESVRATLLDLKSKQQNITVQNVVKSQKYVNLTTHQHYNNMGIQNIKGENHISTIQLQKQFIQALSNGKYVLFKNYHQLEQHKVNQDIIIRNYTSMRNGASIQVNIFNDDGIQQVQWDNYGINQINFSQKNKSIANKFSDQQYRQILLNLVPEAQNVISTSKQKAQFIQQSTGNIIIADSSKHTQRIEIFNKAIQDNLLNLTNYKYYYLNNISQGKQTNIEFTQPSIMVLEKEKYKYTNYQEVMLSQIEALQLIYKDTVVLIPKNIISEDLYFEKYNVYAKETQINGLTVLIADIISVQDCDIDGYSNICKFMIIQGPYNDNFYSELEANIVYNEQEFRFYTKQNIVFITDMYLQIK